MTTRTVSIIALLLAFAPAFLCAQVTLSWQDNSDNEEGFFVYRSVDGTDFFALDSVTEDLTEYQDTALIEGQTYWWRVTAFNEAGESGPSNTVSRTIPEPLPPLPATPGGFDVSFPEVPGHMINASVRVKRTANEGTPIAGFVIGGDTPARVLIRAVGPGLDRLAVPDTLPNPRLALFRGQVQVDQNDDWENTPEILAAFTAVHAFSLTPGSTDAVLLLDLEPGLYTAHAQVSPGTPEEGVVLIEAYQLPAAP